MRRWSCLHFSCLHNIYTIQRPSMPTDMHPGPKTKLIHQRPLIPFRRALFFLFLKRSDVMMVAL